MKTLKMIFLAALVISLTACSEQLDNEQAKQVAEELLEQIDNENYSALNNYYTESFNRGETEEERAAKFKKLRGIMGGIKSVELKDAANTAEFGEPAQVILKYEIERTKVNSIETFTVVKEEGNYRVSNHNITN
jgi:hypothetical protein